MAKRKMRALHLAYTAPIPARCGYDLRALNLCRELGKTMDITLLARTLEPADLPSTLEGLRLRTLHLPRPTPLERATKGLRFLFSRQPVMAAGWYFPEMATAIRQELEQHTYDWVVLEGIWMSVYWPLLEKFPVRKTINHYDLEPEALRRQAEVLPPGLARWLYLNAAHRMEKMEARLVRTAQINWVTSRREQEILQARHPGTVIEVAPNGVDTERLTPLPPPPNRNEILFVGSLSYFPNVDGVLFFVKEVLPLIQTLLPNALFRVVGRNPPDTIKALHAPGRVEITGEVADVEPWYRQAALCVVPLRAGGGTRLKILEAMALGRAVVSTSVGAEGLDVTNQQDIQLADTPQDLASAIVDLLNHPERTEQITQKARRLVEEKYAWTSIARHMARRYEGFCPPEGSWKLPPP